MRHSPFYLPYYPVLTPKLNGYWFPGFRYRNCWRWGLGDDLFWVYHLGFLRIDIRIGYRHYQVDIRAVLEENGASSFGGFDSNLILEDADCFQEMLAFGAERNLAGGLDDSVDLDSPAIIGEYLHLAGRCYHPDIFIHHSHAPDSLHRGLAVKYHCTRQFLRHEAGNIGEGSEVGGGDQSFLTLGEHHGGAIILATFPVLHLDRARHDATDDIGGFRPEDQLLI